jgi:hypothetical protein
VKYRVIDNYLDKEYFDNLVALFNTGDAQDPTVPWYYDRRVANLNIFENNIFYMVHLLYHNHEPRSSLYEHMFPILTQLEVKSLIRIKANLFPNTETLFEHPMHIDYPFSHSGAILYLNTCDGYTKLKDGTKIDSVANRILFFDASEEHCSTTTTNVPARFNININYF